MRNAGMDRRKRLMLDEEPHALNQWGEIARARSELARQREEAQGIWFNFAIWFAAYCALGCLLAFFFWLISKAH